MQNKKTEIDLHLIDLDLDDELEKIDKEFSENGLLLSGSHHRARGKAIIRANFKKEQLLAKSEEQLPSNEIQSKSVNKKGKLRFNINGKIEYMSPSGKNYQGLFTKRENSYKLLFFLVRNPLQEYASTKLIRVINRPRVNSEYTDPDRRIRDTINKIRKEFGLIKDNKKDDFFIINMKHYGLGCDIEIIQ